MLLSDDAIRVEHMTTLRCVLRMVIEKIVDWHNDRLFAAWRAARVERRQA
jgi:hypothetical protein